MEDWRVRGISAGGAAILTEHVTRAWVGAVREAGFSFRSADVGAPALATVATLTALEARRVTDAFVKQAAAEVRRLDAAGQADSIERSMRAAELEEGRRVAALLAALPGGGYYPDWVVVESMDID